MKYLRMHYPKVFPYVNHSPNEGKRTQAQGGFLVGMGMHKGWPDLEVAWPCREWHGLFIEFKTPKGKATPEQSETLANLSSKGYRCEIIRDIESFMALCIDHFGPADEWDLQQLRAYLNEGGKI